MAFGGGFQTPGFQANAFQTGRFVTDGVQFKKVNLDSTFELPPDQFSVEAVGVDLFRNASRSDRVTLSFGLKDV